jgi:Na+/H+ antiporter NhaC
VGIWVAAFIVSGYNPASALLRTLDTYITNAFATDYRIQIILMSFFMSGMVSMLYKAGGGFGMANLFAKYAKTRRSVQVAAFALGVCIFFDDYSSTLLVGMTMRPLTDAMWISREKLAYLVHSTSAPVASLFPITSWIGFEISLIEEAYQNLADEGYDLEAAGWETSPFLVFCNTIPSRYYPLFVLFFQLMLISLDREWGYVLFFAMHSLLIYLRYLIISSNALTFSLFKPIFRPMLRAERRAVNEHKLSADDAKESETQLDEKMEPEVDQPLVWWNGVVPIVTTIIITILALCLTGRDAAIANDLPVTAVNMFGNANSFTSLLYGSFAGLVSCFFLFLLQHKKNGKVVPPSWLPCLPGTIKGSRPLMTWHQCMHWFVEGVKGLMAAVLVLILAWSIGVAMEACGTGIYIAEALKGKVAPGSIPVITFILAALISFATGTSWGTMSILFPIAVPTQFAAAPYNETLMSLTISAILGGAIFGDHTTLISDTCILSCLSSKCDIRHHVKTQFPYAFLCAVCAALVGYLPTGLAWETFPNYAGLLVGGFTVVVIGVLLSVPVASTKMDPLSIVFGKMWTNTRYVPGSWTGFATRTFKRGKTGIPKDLGLDDETSTDADESATNLSGSSKSGNGSGKATPSVGAGLAEDAAAAPGAVIMTGKGDAANV